MEEVVIEESLPKWWSFLLRGLAALAFGIIVIAWPRSTVRVLVILFGIFVLVAGLVAIAGAIAEAKRGDKYIITLILGLVSAFLGILLLAYPGLAKATLLLIIAAWAIIYGFLMVIAAFEFPTGDSRIKWTLALTGAVSMLVGIALLVFPEIGVFTIILIIGAYLIAQGIMLVIVSFWVRALYRELKAA